MAVAGLPRPQRSYLICATPRSGSTLLCQALKDSGLAGRPEEYFEARRASGAPRSARDYFEGVSGIDDLRLDGAPPPAPQVSSLAGVDDYRAHLRFALAAGTGANGVFGAKLMWMHTEDFAGLAGTLPELDGAGLAEVLGELLPGVSYVRVHRRDHVRQAVSLWRAIQTQAWCAGEDAPAPRQGRAPRYSFAAIDHLVHVLRADNRAWRHFFRGQAVVPLEIAYEDMVRDLGGAVRAVLRRVGVDASSGEPARPRMRRQSDALSEHWVERYRTDAAKPVARAG